jgi:uncharacterized protein (DUF2237 family)
MDLVDRRQSRFSSDSAFDGLKAGDSWCLVALRWEEARMAGAAPRVKLRATNIKTLEYVNLGDLKAHQMDLS